MGVKSNRWRSHHGQRIVLSVCHWLLRGLAVGRNTAAGALCKWKEDVTCLDVRMRDRVEAVVVELIVGFNVDVGTFVLRTVAVLGCGENFIL